MKRYRNPKVKLGEFKACWNKLKWDSPDICYFYGKGAKAASYIFHHFCHSVKNSEGRSMLDDLKAYGFDITTLKFSIKATEQTGAVDLSDNAPTSP